MHAPATQPFRDGLLEANVILASGLMTDLIRDLILRWWDDPAGTYQSWFLWDERIKNFRSIRRGLQQIVAEITDGTFGVAYRGSSLETVVHSIAEQRQILRGADHAFLWRPKLRIPDIYENPTNQKVFGQFLDVIGFSWRSIDIPETAAR